LLEHLEPFERVHAESAEAYPSPCNREEDH